MCWFNAYFKHSNRIRRHLFLDRAEWLYFSFTKSNDTKCNDSRKRHLFINGNGERLYKRSGNDFCNSERKSSCTVDNCNREYLPVGLCIGRRYIQYYHSLWSRNYTHLFYRYYRSNLYGCTNL